MNSDEYKAAATDMANYIADYLDNIRDRRALPGVEPGFLRPLIPEEAPEDPESWDDVMKDIERVIMPGVTHWHSPQFMAYFPTANSYPALLADMLCGAIGCIGFTWISSPSCTELEVVMMDWLGKLIGLPEEFLACSGGKGGGVIQGTASEATLVALLSAKVRTVKKHLSWHPDKDKYSIVSKLVAYASDQAHCSAERAGMLAGVTMRLVPSDDDLVLRGAAFEKAVEEDIEAGLIPFFICATIGTTSACSFDNLRELGTVSREHDIWMHVDAAYAGSAFVCEEFRYLINGVELAESFNFNPHKWLLVNFDCSAMWLKNANDVVDAFNVDPLYLRHERQGQAPDYRHWQIPLGRRFRSLKLWFVMRLYGRKKLQEHIKKQVALAHEFEEMLLTDCRFELYYPVTLGLVTFRLKGNEEINEALVKAINANGIIHLVPGRAKGTFFLRLAICSRFTESSDVRLAWKEIQKQASLVLDSPVNDSPDDHKINHY